MKNIRITLTLPEELIKELHLYIPHRQISKFVAHVVEQAIELKKEMLACEFREASQDPGRQKEIALWDSMIDDKLKLSRLKAKDS